MKKIYTIIGLFLISLSSLAQGYQFGIVHNSGYNFSIIAIPDFNATNTDISDIGFTLMLPAGNADVTNLSMFYGRAWSSIPITAAQFTGLGLGDGTKDGFALNMPPGQTILSHTSGQEIILLTFDVSNMPITGQLHILLNNDPIAIGLNEALDCFYNSNIDSTSTEDYYSGILPGMGSFEFSALGIDEVDVSAIKLNIYPNPTSDVIHISSNVELTKLELFDILGKQVLTTKNCQELNIAHLKTGVYLLKMQSSKGQLTQKIIKL